MNAYQNFVETICELILKKRRVSQVYKHFMSIIGDQGMLSKKNFLEKKVYLSQWFLYSCWATATWFIETDIFRRRKKNVEDTPRKVSQLFFFIVKCIILFFLQIYTTMNVFECLFAPLQVFIDHPLIHCSNERIFLFVKSRSLYQKWKKKKDLCCQVTMQLPKMLEFQWCLVFTNVQIYLLHNATVSFSNFAQYEYDEFFLIRA